LITNQLTQLTTNPASEYNPALSPDGKKIAFVSEGKESGIYILEKGIKLRIAPSSLKVAAPSWSKNGDLLLYSAFERTSTKLFLTNVKNHTTKEISADEDIFPFRASWFDSRSFLYTANGKIQKRILGNNAIESIPFNADLTLKRVTYKRKQYSFDDQKDRQPLGITGPDISPDGNNVAFSALGDIFVQTIGGKITRITNDHYVDIDPDWSPDGKKLAYVSDRGGEMEIWLHDMNTGVPKLLTTGLAGSASEPSWSYDGNKIAFYIKDRNEWGRGILYVADLNTSEVRKIHDKLFVPGKPSWSPNGKTIALMALKPCSSRYREGINEFLMLSLDDKPGFFVSPGSFDNPAIRGQNGPVWSPDGTRLAYVQDGVLWTIAINEKGEITGKPVQVTTELADKISWSGDSKCILYLATDHLKKVNIETGKSTDILIDLKWKPHFPKDKYIIHAGKLFNGVDSTYLHNMDIMIDGHRIKSITPHNEHSTATVLDASDKVVIPGLFESHTHMHSGTGEKLGRIFLSYGITSVRETGADPYDALERKESWSGGVCPGPRLFSTGFLDGSRVYYGLSNPVIHKPHLMMELERAKKLGFDLMKTYVRMPDSVQKEIIVAAHKLGIPVSSHEIYPAPKYNVDAVEHFRGTSRHGYNMKLSALNKIYNDVIQIIVNSGITITPTIVLQEGFLKIVKDDSNFLDNRQFNALYPKDFITDWAKRPPKTNYGPNLQELQKTICTLLNSGGTISAGTDSPFVPYGVSLHAELWLYADGGLTPFQALQTATIKAAEAVGVGKDLGSVEPGKLADLVIVNGDPLHNIRDSWNVETVIKNGTIYPINELLQK
jgi:Tol biopolymer transport system component